jgi:hypothetical protein
MPVKLQPMKTTLIYFGRKGKTSLGPSKRSAKVKMTIDATCVYLIGILFPSQLKKIAHKV